MLQVNSHIFAIKINDIKYFHVYFWFLQTNWWLHNHTIDGPLSVILSENKLKQKLELSIHPNLSFTNTLWMILLVINRRNKNVKMDLLTYFRNLMVVSTTFLLVCFLCLKGSTCETRKNVFYFTLKAFFVPEIIKF